MCTVLLPPGDNPTAVNKYIISSLNLGASTSWNPLGLPGIEGMILNTSSTTKFINDLPGIETRLEAG